MSLHIPLAHLLTPHALDAIEQRLEAFGDKSRALNPKAMQIAGIPPSALQLLIDEVRALRTHLLAVLPQAEWQDDQAAAAAIAHLRKTCGVTCANAMLRDAKISIEKPKASAV